MLAPIILFVYNRPLHTQRTVEALAKNFLAKESLLYIFCDGPKKPGQNSVEETRQFVHSLPSKKLFKQVIIFESENNKGLAASIISGVSKIMSDHGKVIVIEDDNISSPDFLTFMNQCLDFYKENNKIWSIGGYSFINNLFDLVSADAYFCQRTCSYAWATWKNRWERVDWKVSDYSSFKRNPFDRWKFNQQGNDRAIMLDNQMNGKIDSWAIRFCFYEFKNDMMTVYPTQTKIQNIGHDGSGTHAFLKESSNKLQEKVFPEPKRIFLLPSNVVVNRFIRKAYKKRFNLAFGTRSKMIAKKILNKFVSKKDK